jgi:hypothetical protein
MELLVLIGITIPFMLLAAFLYASVLQHFFKREVDWKQLVAQHGYRIGFIVMIVMAIVIICFF